MGKTRLMEHLWYVYGLLEGHTACTAYYSAIVVELTNHDFPSPGWKIAIGSLSTSALAAFKIQFTASLEHYLKGSPEGTLEVDFLHTFFASYGFISYIFLLCFTVLLK